MYSLLQRLIQQNSANPPGGEEAVALVIRDYLASIGVSSRLVPVSEGRSGLVALIGKPAGSGESPSCSLGFSGHLDVVPVSAAEREGWKCDPFCGYQDDKRVWGRGSADMKGGLAAILTALKIRLQRDAVLERPIVLAFSCDEEDRMSGVRALVGVPELRGCTEMIVAEPTGLKLCHASRGRTWATITVSGKTGHGSHHDLHNNAIVQAHYLLHEILCEDFSDTYTPQYESSFWQPLTMQAGVPPGIVPDRVTMDLDCRVVPGDSCARVWERFERVLTRLRAKMPDICVHIDVIDKRDPWKLPPSHPFVQTVSEAMQHAWQERVMETAFFLGSSDANIWMHHGICSLIIGPGSLDMAHSANEYVDKSELDDAVSLYLELMK